MKATAQKTIAIAVLIVTSAGTALAKDVPAKLQVSGMTCPACAISVKSALSKTKGVKQVNINDKTGLTTVVYDDSQVKPQQLLDAVHRTGFKAETIEAAK